jgi:apolipoprotein N-acyltransferase
MVIGLYAGIFSLGAFHVSRTLSWPLQGLFCGLLWTCLEIFRSILLTGFPWLTLSQALAPWPAAIQAASLVGAFGLSGMLTALTIWAVHIPRSRPALFVAGAGMLSLAAFGLFTLDRDTLGSESELQVAIVQGNIDQNRKWNPAYQNATLQTYLDLSRRALQSGDPGMFIWPETALPFYLQDQSPYTEKVLEFCDRNDVFLLTGAPAYARRGPGDYDTFNRSYLVDADGKVADSYDKQHLVPFGEYVPLKRFFPWIGNLVAQIGDFTPGDSAAPLRQDSLALGVLICYEIIFPELVRERVEAGANLLVNQSNDAWFGDSSAPEQHLHLAVLRAVEQRRTILRATNTGISALIDPWGRIVSRTGLFVPATLTAESLLTVDRRTVYSRHASKLRALFMLALAAMIGMAWHARRSRQSPQTSKKRHSS